VLLVYSRSVSLIESLFVESGPVCVSVMPMECYPYVCYLMFVCRVNAMPYVMFESLSKKCRDFYFCALGSLVVLSVPQLLSFFSIFPKPLSKTLIRSLDGRNPVQLTVPY
jgi:hypothetical protein